MENTENLDVSQPTTAQLNIRLTGQEAEDFNAYMAGEGFLTRSAAGYKLIFEGLRRWKARTAEQASAG